MAGGTALSLPEDVATSTCIKVTLLSGVQVTQLAHQLHSQGRQPADLGECGLEA